MKAAGVKQSHLFDFGFTTDGVCARVKLRVPTTGKGKRKVPGADAPETPSRREPWAIDAFKSQCRLEDLHVIGLDPGKRELAVAVDTDDPKGCTPVRYTQVQRRHEMNKARYDKLEKEAKPAAVTQNDEALSGFCSRSAHLEKFCAYCAKRREGMEARMSFYAGIEHRRRRWKTYIKMQKSEQRFYERLAALHRPLDTRRLVVAYGAWGAVAGVPGTACNRGNPPCIGVGLMRKLAKRFTVVLTPEAYTSKTCCKCLGVCGAWKTRPDADGKQKEIRGLRRCTERDCMMPLNRDKNGAVNIGTQFKRLMRGQGPIRSMTAEELAFHRADVCLECE